MKNLIKQIEKLDKVISSQIAEVLKGTVVDDSTLILLKSDDFSRRLKGLKSILTSLSTDLLTQLSSKDDKDVADLLDKRFKRVETHLNEVIKIVRHLKAENKFKNTNQEEQIPTEVPKPEGGPY